MPFVSTGKGGVNGKPTKEKDALGDTLFYSGRQNVRVGKHRRLDALLRLQFLGGGCRKAPRAQHLHLRRYRRGDGLPGRRSPSRARGVQRPPLFSPHTRRSPARLSAPVRAGAGVLPPGLRPAPLPASPAHAVRARRPAAPEPFPRRCPEPPAPPPRQRRTRTPGALGGSCPGESSPHEVVPKILAPDIVRRLPHQRARHGRAGPRGRNSALPAAPRSPMTPGQADRADTAPARGPALRQLGSALRPRRAALLLAYGRAEGGRQVSGLARTPRTPSPRPSAGLGGGAGCRKQWPGPEAIGGRLLGTRGSQPSGCGGDIPGRAVLKRALQNESWVGLCSAGEPLRDCPGSAGSRQRSGCREKRSRVARSLCPQTKVT